MTHELLGKHKPSAEWYTTPDLWERIENTFNTPAIFDPCKIKSEVDGLSLDWAECSNLSVTGSFCYVNPPTPAAPWALKAIQTHLEHPEVNIIFACFSEAVLWQVNSLMDFPVCWVRNRISWIDGNEWVKWDGLIAKEPREVNKVDGKWVCKNPNYLKPAKSPRNYNAFVCLSVDTMVLHRFRENFKDLGTIRRSYDISLG